MFTKCLYKVLKIYDFSMQFGACMLCKYFFGVTGVTIMLPTMRIQSSYVTLGQVILGLTLNINYFKYFRIDMTEHSNNSTCLSPYDLESETQKNSYFYLTLYASRTLPIHFSPFNRRSQKVIHFNKNRLGNLFKLLSYGNMGPVANKGKTCTL